MRMSLKKFLKRNLRFWGKHSVGYSLAIVGFSMLYGLFTSDLTEDFGFVTLTSTILTYGMFMSAIMFISYSTQYASNHIPLALSFGSGREEAVWGVLLSNLIYVVLNTLWFSLLAVFVSQSLEYRVMGALVSAVVTVLILFAVAGQFCTAWMVKLGGTNRAALVTILIMMTMAMVAITVFIIFQLQRDDSGLIVWFLSNPRSHFYMIIAVMLAVLAVLYVLGFMALRRVVRTYEVRI